MVNKATLFGRISKKIVHEATPLKSRTVVYLSTYRKHTDNKGEKKEFIYTHPVNCFNKIAEIINKNTQVGDLLYVEGEIANKQIEDLSGNARWIYCINASEIRLIPFNTKDKNFNEEKYMIDF